MKAPNVGTIMGHPKGLFLLFGTEMWERFSYYGMRALLVLYLVDRVENGGFGWSNADALALYGWFTMLVYFTNLPGGWLADNVLGQRKSIIIGGSLMALGQFTLFIPHEFLAGNAEQVFYIGLGLIIIGNGMFKPNISTMVGDLYEEGDNRRDGAYTIFYMGINIGGFISPLICGYVGETMNWQYGFLVAGVGMVISVIMQAKLANKYLGDIGVVPNAKLKQQQNNSDSSVPLTKEERDRVKVILIMSVFSIIFWAGFEQAGGLFNIYAFQFTDRMLFGFEVPASWFQSVNSLFIILFAPMFASIWINMGDKEPTSPAKFGIALLLLAVGFVFMIGAAMEMGASDAAKSSMIWLILAYMFHTFGELCLSPIGLSMVSKLAPLKFMSLLMGAWFLCTAIANKLAAFIGSFVGEGDGGANADNLIAIFGGLAGAAVICGIILFLLADKLVEWMHGAEGHHPANTDEALDEELAVTGAHEAMPTQHN